MFWEIIDKNNTLNLSNLRVVKAVKLETGRSECHHVMQWIEIFKEFFPFPMIYYSYNLINSLRKASLDSPKMSYIADFCTVY